MAKLIEKITARSLRLKGESIKDIAKKLSVSPGSVHKWCQDIQLTYSQKKKLEKKVFKALQKGRKKVAKQQREKHLKEIKKFRKVGIKEIGKLSKRELFLAGVALYWAEGFKKDQRLGFANSDPRMILFFLKWLTEICGVNKESIRLRVGLNISHQERIQEVEKYWSELTSIPLKQFQKAFFQQFKWKKEFKKPEEYLRVSPIY